MHLELRNDVNPNVNSTGQHFVLFEQKKIVENELTFKTLNEF